MNDIEARLEELYRSSYATFESVLATVARDREAARDAVQEAFAVALTRKRQFRQEGSLEGWVWKIALRLAAGQRPASAKPLADHLDPAVPEPELHPALAAAIRGLPPRRRLFVFLRYYADLTYDEIAEACDVSRGTVAAALAHARAELRGAVERETLTGGLIR